MLPHIEHMIKHRRPGSWFRLPGISRRWNKPQQRAENNISIMNRDPANRADPTTGKGFLYKFISYPANCQDAAFFHHLGEIRKTEPAEICLFFILSRFSGREP